MSPNWTTIVTASVVVLGACVLTALNHSLAAAALGIVGTVAHAILPSAVGLAPKETEVPVYVDKDLH